jgi:hypothetical protein
MSVQKYAQKYQRENKQPILPIDDTRKQRYQKSARKIRKHICPETVKAKKIGGKTAEKGVCNEVFRIQAMEKSIYDHGRKKRIKKI